MELLDDFEIIVNGDQVEQVDCNNWENYSFSYIEEETLVNKSAAITFLAAVLLISSYTYVFKRVETPRKYLNIIPIAASGVIISLISIYIWFSVSMRPFWTPIIASLILGLFLPLFILYIGKRNLVGEKLPLYLWIYLLSFLCWLIVVYYTGSTFLLRIP